MSTNSPTPYRETPKQTVDFDLYVFIPGRQDPVFFSNDQWGLVSCDDSRQQLVVYADCDKNKCRARFNNWDYWRIVPREKFE